MEYSLLERESKPNQQEFLVPRALRGYEMPGHIFRALEMLKGYFKEIKIPWKTVSFIRELLANLEISGTCDPAMDSDTSRTLSFPNSCSLEPVILLMNQHLSASFSHSLSFYCHPCFHCALSVIYTQNSAREALTVSVIYRSIRWDFHRHFLGGTGILYDWQKDLSQLCLRIQSGHIWFT